MRRNMTERSSNHKSVLRMVEELFLFFLLVSFVGWVYEVFLEVVVYRWGYSDRGVLTGPYCIIYGTGILILLLFLYKLLVKKVYVGSLNITPLLVFVGIVVVATIVELIASYIMEWTVGAWMWDYTRFAFDFQGRIAPNPSIRFGLGGMVVFYGVAPLFKKLLDKQSDKSIHMVAAILFVLFAMDCITYLL